MGLLNLLKSWFSQRGRAMSHYRSGMDKAKKDDFSGAILEYSACMESPGIPPDVTAMALYNRALAYSAIDENVKAADDLTAVLKLPGLPDKIKTAASQRKERIRRRDAAD